MLTSWTKAAAGRRSTQSCCSEHRNNHEADLGAAQRENLLLANLGHLTHGLELQIVARAELGETLRARLAETSAAANA
jgi:hypothetical protein